MRAKARVVLVGFVVLIAIAAALGIEGRTVAAAVIFVGSYLALAIDRIPGQSNILISSGKGSRGQSRR